MKATRLCLIVLAVALAWTEVSSGQGRPQNPRHPIIAASGGIPERGPASTFAILYDQTDNDAGSAVVSQDFETAFDAFDTEGADDFVVPPGTAWSIESVTTLGQYFNGTGPAALVNLTFFSDAAGLPGSAVCSYPLQTPADTAGTFVFTLPTPCVLGPGSYWLDVQVRMDLTPNGEWGWESRTVQSNTGSLWRNPGDGFTTGCTGFSPTPGCVAGAGPDFAFSLSGTLGFGVVPAGPPECGAATPLIFDNATPVPILDSAVATSTIVVSGAGAYLWDLNVLTHILHSFNPDLDITITSPAGTVVTLTTDNGLTADVFNGTVWDDQADPGSQVPYSGNPALVTDHSYTGLVTANPLAPEEALGAFIGENPNGTWTITISDDQAGDTGSLNGWALSVAALPSAPIVVVTTATSNLTPTPIADSAVTVSTVSLPSGIGTRICKLTLMTDITHTFNGDLDITLASPAGTVVTLTTDNGSDRNDVFHGTLWDDQANPGGQVPYTSNDGLANDTTYVDMVTATTLVPEEALAAFNGENPTGTWTLTISDDSPFDIGTLNAWTLNVTTCSCAVSLADAPLRVDEHAGSSTSSNLNAVFEVGETVQVEPSWMNVGATPFVLALSANGFIGPAGPTYTFVDDIADYGTVAPSSTSNCFDATGDCYQMQIAGTRPMQHWDATFDEVALPIAGPTTSVPYFETWTLHVGESFPDVPTGNLFYRFIETIFHKGVTGGCGGGNYCPAATVTRAQMAVFLLKAKNGSAYVPPACTGTVFGDVPCTGGIFDPWIEDLSGQGITGGCGSGNYCPGNPVTRAQMAVFLLKTNFTSSYVPPACTGTVFTDVPCTGGIFDPWIEDLAGRGITGGCGSGNYCPGSPNTRGQMAVFLTKTFGLLLYGP